LNIGTEYANTSDWLLVINNDLVFEYGWLDRIMDASKSRPDVDSFSPFEPDFHNEYYRGWANSEINESYEVNFGVCGWCILMKKSVMTSMVKWDERFLSWYQDNDYSEFLKFNGIKNALIRSSIVHHLGGSSINLMEDKSLMTLGMKKVFEDKWDQIKGMKKPKIKICHLLLDPNEPQDITEERWASTINRQNYSIASFEKIATNFACYSKMYTVVNRTDLPSDNCAQPEIINTSKEFVNIPPVLSYGHYGCYSAHRSAIEDFGNYDAILVIEGDAIYDISTNELSESIYDAYNFGIQRSASVITFGEVSYGWGSRASAMDTSVEIGEYKKIDHFLMAHCYMVFKSEKEIIQYKLANTGWHAWDIWFYWNYDNRVPIFSTRIPLVKQASGYSVIDYGEKKL
jgi:hypothetical protein